MFGPERELDEWVRRLNVDESWRGGFVDARILDYHAAIVAIEFESDEAAVDFVEDKLTEDPGLEGSLDVDDANPLRVLWLR